MAIGITYKSSVYQTTNTASTFTGAPTWTPAANSLLVCFVCTAYSTAPTDPSGVSGHGISYSKLTLGTSSLSGLYQLSVWVAKAGSSPTSAAPVATVTSTNGTGDLLIEFEVTGHDNSGTALQAIVASTATNTGSGTAATVTLAAAYSPSNRAMTFVVCTANAAPTATGGWTLTAGAAGNFNTPATGAAAFFKTSAFDTAGAATVSSSSWRMIGIEIKAAPLLYYVIYPAAGGDPSATQVKAGQDSTGGAATASGSEGSTSALGATVETFAAAATGLTVGTSYKVAFVWTDGAFDSNVSIGSFSTDDMMGQACL